MIGIRFNRQTERQCDDLTFQRQTLYLSQIVHETSSTICLGVTITSHFVHINPLPFPNYVLAISEPSPSEYLIKSQLKQNLSHQASLSMVFEKLSAHKKCNIFVQIVWFESTILQKVLSFYVEICLLQQPPSLTCSLSHRLVFTCYSVLTRSALSAQSDIQQMCHISLIHNTCYCFSILTVETLKVQNILCSQLWNSLDTFTRTARTRSDVIWEQT